MYLFEFAFVQPLVKSMFGIQYQENQTDNILVKNSWSNEFRPKEVRGPCVDNSLFVMVMI